MLFTTDVVPSVESRVRDAMRSMHLDPETHQGLFDVLHLSLYRPSSLDGKTFEAKGHDIDVQDRLQAIVTSVLKAQSLAQTTIPRHEPSEALLCAIATRDLVSGGDRGLTIIKRTPEGAAFAARVESLQTGFERVMKEAISRPRGYATLDPEGQWLLEFHALDFTQRSLLLLSNPEAPPKPSTISCIMANAQRVRVLLADVTTPLARKFKVQLDILDREVTRPKGMMIAPVKDDIHSWNPTGTVGTGGCKIIPLRPKTP
ncbi:MAG: hypothetical protein KGQ41_04130 [Alphaproteobacteria bacterium]|nr:hypothetical protein [Alphaproteobacteria bacterium]